MAKAERSAVIAQLSEVFRNYGYEGASLAHITAGTGLGKGSLYHFFPGGKEDMATAVLAEIDAWFVAHVFDPLRLQDAAQGVATMFDEVRRYFHGGARVCLVGVFALGNERDYFSNAINGYFAAWATSLQNALQRLGHDDQSAEVLAEETLIAIQGALVIARAWNDPAAFIRTLDRVAARLQPPGSTSSS